MFPVIIHFGQDISFKFSAEVEKKLCSGRNRVTLKILYILNTNELEEVLHLNHVSSSFEPSLTRLVNLGSRDYTIY
jgi:hypothetical protein